MNMLVSPDVYNAPSRRGVLAAALASLGVVGLAFAQNAQSESIGSSSEVPAVVCVFSGERPFTFGKDNFQGGGINDAVHAIVGSGDGLGDPCFEQAQDVVKKAAGTHAPQYGQRVVIPQSVLATTVNS